MLKFILKRLLEAIPTLWVIATLTFFMVRLAPGGPFDGERSMPPEIREQLNAHYGLDRPLMVQYWDFITKAVRGDLGPSFKYQGWNVSELIAKKCPISLELAIYSMALAIFWGMGVGILASFKPNTWMDYLPMSLTTLGICLPTFVLGPLLILVISIKLDWLHSSGWTSLSDRILPTICLAIYYGAYIARMTRGSLMEIRNQPYIRTAYAKGLSRRRIYFLHALRNGLQPVVAYLGPCTAGLITGSFIVETIFNIPGLGRFFIDSAFNRDYTMVMGCILFYATLIIIMNLLVDIIQTVLNPRQKLQ